MSLTEQYFPPLSRYNRTNEGMPVNEVEAWLNKFPSKRAENKPNGGIIQSVADTREIFLRPMSVSERKKAIAQAQREHRQALRNLAKQDAMDSKEIAKQLTVWRRESRKSEINSEMKSSKGQAFLEQIKEKGVYHIKDFNRSKAYLQKIVREARALGYQIEPVRESKTIVSYKLINKQ